jgi:hypothetical protein
VVEVHMAPSKKASTTPWNHASLNHSTLFETGSYIPTTSSIGL